MQMIPMSMVFHPDLSPELQTHGCSYFLDSLNLDVLQHLKLNMSKTGLLIFIPRSAPPMFPIPVNSTPGTSLPQSGKWALSSAPSFPSTLYKFIH